MNIKRSLVRHVHISNSWIVNRKGTRSQLSTQLQCPLGVENQMRVPIPNRQLSNGKFREKQSNSDMVYLVH